MPPPTRRHRARWPAEPLTCTALHTGAEAFSKLGEALPALRREPLPRGAACPALRREPRRDASAGWEEAADNFPGKYLLENINNHNRTSPALCCSAQGPRGSALAPPLTPATSKRLIMPPWSMHMQRRGEIPQSACELLARGRARSPPSSCRRAAGLCLDVPLLADERSAEDHIVATPPRGALARA